MTQIEQLIAKFEQSFHTYQREMDELQRRNRAGELQGIAYMNEVSIACSRSDRKLDGILKLIKQMEELVNMEYKDHLENIIEFSGEAKNYIEQERYGKALDSLQWMLDKARIELIKLDKKEASNELQIRKD